MRRIFQVMSEVIIEVRTNNTNEGDPLKAGCLKKHFNLAKKHQMSTEYFEPDASLIFHI